MSSFVVDDETIRRIVTHLYRCVYDSRGRFTHVVDSLRKMKYDVDSENGDCDEIGTDLLSLNYQAVNARYNTKDGLQQVYKHSDLHAPIIQVLKSVQCLVYQCSEGDVPKQKLYKFLQEYERSLMSSIICDLPEYDAAKWG